MKQIEAQNEALRIEAEKEKVRLAHELELAKVNATNSGVVPVAAADVVRPTLPVFKEGEDMASYLIRFERISSLLNLKPDTLAVRLGSLLTGKAVDIYTSLSPTVTADYKQLKQALLQGFNKTPSGYRQEFRSAKIRVDETYKQFSINLGRFFDQWVDSYELEKTYDKLRDFVIQDQFISSLSPDLRTYIKEHNVSTLEKTVQLANNWSAAHNAYPKTNSASKGKRNVDPKPQASVPSSSDKAVNSKIKCFNCGESGHYKSHCPKNPLAFKSIASHKVEFCLDDSSPRQYHASGTVNGARVSTILRDTGCSCILVSEEVLPDVDTLNAPKVKLNDYLGRVDIFPSVRCYIKCPYYIGWADVVRAPIKFCSVLIGNVPGASKLAPIDESSQSKDPPIQDEKVGAVQTRSHRNKRIHPLVLPKLQAIDITPVDFAKLQKSCTSLANIRDKVKSGETHTSRDGTVYCFKEVDGLMYRHCISSKFDERIGKRSLVVPSECRNVVTSVAHESPLAGHFSHRKTMMRVVDQFFWPGMCSDVRDFVRSCDKCQRMSHKGRVKPVPLKPLPIITEPFSRCAIDLVGPLNPPSAEGHRYILTLVDFATGFPEAIPLKEIDSVSVAEALLVIFSRVGIPREILSDRGTQFTSHLMGELHKLLGVKPLFTSPYHPSGNGRVERFHSTLKSSLRKLCSDKPRDWHRYLIPTLFALREIPSDRTGFSPFELLYGRTVRGPITVLRDLWEDRTLNDDDRTTYQYVIELQDKLADCAKVAAQNADISSARYKSYFDVKSQSRSFKPGDEVLVLLPDSTHKLLMAWSGPYKVVERKNKVNYCH